MYADKEAAYYLRAENRNRESVYGLETNGIAGKDGSAVMQHFFVEPSQIMEKEIRITGADVNHIRKVLRMKEGEELSIGNGMDDTEYRCRIDHFTEDEVVCRICFIKEDGVELPARIYLFQGLPKSDKMELIVQKAVELGVYEIIPVVTKRTVVKLDDKKAKSKTARWQAVSEAAAKQSKRAVIPVVRDPMTMQEAVAYAKGMEAKAIPYELAKGMEAARAWFSFAVEAADIAIFIGPEGGFEESEIDLAKEAGITPISLGRRILRTETAGLTILSILMYQLETKDI